VKAGAVTICDEAAAETARRPAQIENGFAKTAHSFAAPSSRIMAPPCSACTGADPMLVSLGDRRKQKSRRSDARRPVWIHAVVRAQRGFAEETGRAREAIGRAAHQCAQLTSAWK
jgi:hypothetical protein